MSDKTCEELKLEIAALTKAMDRMSVVYDQRIDQICRIYAGFIMEQCGVDELRFNPSAIFERFQPGRVEVEPYGAGMVRYRLLPAIGGDNE